ncbi:biopolymer transporter ExbD [Rhodocaloribacter litoris]|uniref:ExbD/TolR family protein n=1 Tax=Rhodocaloribacter litoris TaxID=2558931 RepID=UPI001422488B|nr:biopolymer transporter ExbD [Rhodocaloribacter litoris]QXD15365.1 biopolymer transporter ExbD [Rhodocaloribacter litoris]
MSSINFSTSKKPLTAYSLAGLADIVLLLLIFFLLTSSFIPQFGIQVNLPQASASAPMEEQYVTVSITDDGRFYVDQRQVPREGLLDAIREARGTRAALVLRADREATVGDFARVAAIAKALNLRVLMATERGLELP